MITIKGINGRGVVIMAAGTLCAVLGMHWAQAYETYDGCVACHGDFRGPTSTKGTIFPSNNNHEMHRASTSMGSSCNLCHIGSSRTPVYINSSTGTASNSGIGCIGCHVGEGLRLHHVNSGVGECLDCHDPAPSVPETVKPPYYGTADTKVKEPENRLQVANTNENWSIGDFLGLDNDGNNLYDLADYAVGPYQLLSATQEGNNMRISWLTAGGRTNVVQAASSVAGTFADVSTPIGIAGVGLKTNTFVEAGGATNAMRYYRMKAAVP